jgi:CBS domain-containing protein
MRVRDLMTAKPITVSPDMPMLQARQRMVDERIRHLIVMEGDRVVGIVTESDFVRAMAGPVRAA